MTTLSHAAIIIREFFAKNSTNFAPQPPYFPDMSIFDFFLFSQFEKLLRGTRFDSVESIKWKSEMPMESSKSEYGKCETSAFGQLKCVVFSKLIPYM